MNLRKFIFLMLDRGKYSVKEQLNEIKLANIDDEFAKKLHNSCVNNLIKYVKENVPFYMNINANTFEEFPVVNKVMMKEDMSLFRSRGDITISKIRHTSGSTGIPFEIMQDSRKAKRIQAEVIYYREITGDELGNKFINLISPSRLEVHSKLSSFKQNVLNFDVTNMDEQTLQKLYKLLNKKNNVSYMLGYTSALEKIADFIETNNLKTNFSLKAIVGSSEVMTDQVMQRLSKIFKCRVYDRYSNEDNGFIAQTDGINHDFYVNRGSYYIEILKLDKDVLAEENEIGRIVITDYYNYSQPFLRYDTGDLGSYSYRFVNGTKRYVLTKLAGRMSDIVYGNNNQPISTFAIGCAFETFSKIKQYQLIQEDKNSFIINIIDPNRYYDNDEYVQVLKELVGNNINVEINYKDTIPTLNSGSLNE